MIQFRTGALGVRIKATSEERENERRVLREAKGSLNPSLTFGHKWTSQIFFTERKLLAAKQREEMWNNWRVLREKMNLLLQLVIAVPTTHVDATKWKN